MGVRHRFHIDQDTGHRMHYVESGDTSPGSELVIMVSTNVDRSSCHVMLTMSDNSYMVFQM